MSEFWVSKKKYWCKYCEIFITDDKPSRLQHENGGRHKGNKDRFIKNLYKSGENDAREKAALDKQLAAIGSAAMSGMSYDGPVASTSASEDRPAKPKRPPSKWNGGLSNYTSAAQLGVSQEEIEAWEAELKSMRGRPPRQSDAKAGEWQVVRPVTKRPIAAVDGGPVDEEDELPTFKSFKRERVAPLDDADIYDPGAISIKKEEDVKPLAEAIGGEPEESEDVKPAVPAPSLFKKRKGAANRRVQV